MKTTLKKQVMGEKPYINYVWFNDWRNVVIYLKLKRIKHRRIKSTKTCTFFTMVNSGGV